MTTPQKPDTTAEMQKIREALKKIEVEADTTLNSYVLGLASEALAVLDTIEQSQCSHIFMVEDSHLKCMGCGLVVSEPYKVTEFLKTLDPEKINLVIFPSDYLPKKPEHEAITGAKQCVTQRDVGEDEQLQNEVCSIVSKYGVPEIYDATDEILSVIEKYRPSAQGWRSIESAPRDGTMILASCLTVDQACFQTVVWWDKREKDWQYAHQTYARCVTHWMPLPSPPTQTTGV